LILDAYQKSLYSHTPAADILGTARENLLLAFRAYLRQTALAETVLANRRAVVAAGIYENPLQPLNDATNEYLDKLDFALNPTIRKQQQNNQELYEKWKALFGKIDE
jgi:hypothetical protein